MTHTTDDRVWFVTGSSTGLGRAICEAALEAGQRVVATARRPEDVADLAGPRWMTAALDVTEPAQVRAAVEAAKERFGRVDVLVNNAGYGEMGCVEEFDLDRARRQFEVNVFGVLTVQREVLPVMRAQGSGHVLNMSSIAGLASFAMAGMYCASKHALEAISEALAQEVAPFGVRVTLVEPGRFRTDFAGRSLGLPPTSGEAYRELTEGYRTRAAELDGAQEGDPVKAAQAVLAVVEADDPPLRLLLGQDAWDLAHEKLARLRADVDAWEHVTRGTGFEDAGA